jgi:hypothetical protein
VLTLQGTLFLSSIFFSFLYSLLASVYSQYNTILKLRSMDINVDSTKLEN